MAQFGIAKKPLSIVAAASLVTFVFLLAYAAATHTPLGGTLYALSLAPIVIGMIAKEDDIAILGVVGLNVLVILDVFMHIGFLYGIWGF